MEGPHNQTHRFYAETSRMRTISLFNLSRYKSLTRSDDAMSKFFNVKIIGAQKSSAAANNLKQKANKIFKKDLHSPKEHIQMWSNYSLSIMAAPPASEELVEGFYNRANFFFHLKKYEESLLDIKRAFAYSHGSEELTSKLKNLQSMCNKTLSDKTMKFEVGNDKKESWHDLKIESQESIPCASEAIKIEYNAKYGRHLRATRDIKPGELLIKERVYMNFVNYSEAYRHCAHCSKMVYSSVPCGTCAYALYCSNDCKNEAWKKYHKTECKILHKIWCTSPANDLSYIVMALRLFLIALHEVGSIEKLQSLVNSIDCCEDPIKVGFEGGKFLSDSCKSLFSLSISPFLWQMENKDNLLTASTAAGVATFFLATETNIFGTKYNAASAFINTDKAIFVCTILERLILIKLTNGFAFIEFQDAVKRNAVTPSNLKMIGSSISLFSSLLNHSCSPNVIALETENREMLVFAIRPILKNSQIFICYQAEASQYERKDRIMLLKMRAFVCDCKACEENWPTVFTAPSLPSMYSKKSDVHNAMEKYSKAFPTPFDKISTALKTTLESYEIVLKHVDGNYKEVYLLLNRINALYKYMYTRWFEVPLCHKVS